MTIVDRGRIRGLRPSAQPHLYGQASGKMGHLVLGSRASGAAKTGKEGGPRTPYPPKPPRLDAGF